MRGDALPEEIVDHVDHFSSVHVDQQRIIPVAHPGRARGRIGQLVHRGIDPVLLAEIGPLQLVADAERAIAIAERIVIDAEAEQRPVVVAIAPPVVAAIVAPIAVPIVGARPARVVTRPAVRVASLLLGLALAEVTIAVAAPVAPIARPAAGRLVLLNLTTLAGKATAVAAISMIGLLLLDDLLRCAIGLTAEARTIPAAA